MSNVIVHDPRPWFAEYLNSNLKKESAEEVFGKIASVIARLNELTNPAATSIHEQKKQLFAFISDSCNLMKAVRLKMSNRGTVQLTYGCSAHALNNFCEDIAKLPSVKEAIRRGVFVPKTIKNQNLLNKIFSLLCGELVGKEYVMVLYSASRWSSVNFMFVRLKKVKRAIIGVVSAVLNEKEEREIDETYDLLTDFATTVMDGNFWRSVMSNVNTFDPICKCIGILENNSATLGTVYACFVYVYLHIGQMMGEEDAEHLCGKLEYRWNRISSPVHALAFYCDPVWQPFRHIVVASGVSGQKAIELGKGVFFAPCRAGIDTLCRNEEDNGTKRRAATSEFFTFSGTDGDAAKEWGNSAHFRHKQLWTQEQAKFPVLSALLMKIYTVPASTAGVECQHKVAKRIHTAPRNRMSSGKVEQQVAIAHNGAVAEMSLLDERQPLEVFIQKHPLDAAELVAPIENPPSSTMATSSGEDEVEIHIDDDFDEVVAAMTEDELAEQEALSAALSLINLSLIQDIVLFPPREEF